MQRTYLGKNNIIPYWTYKYDDKTTWKYIDLVLGEDGKELEVKKWILNPHFAYKHLDPYYPKDEIKENMDKRLYPSENEFHKKYTLNLKELEERN